MRTVILALACAFAFPAVADAHLLRLPDHPKKTHLENRLASQTENLRHCRYVGSYGSGVNARWHRSCVRWLTPELEETRAQIQRRLEAAMSPQAAICAVFGPHCSAAISVARCETGGTFSVYAQNGQYLGLFQMGEYARATYGHSWTAIGQARAAYAYFRDAGWSPWQCLPGGGLRW